MHFLSSERLYFRALEESDADGPYLSWMNDPEVTCFLESRFFPHSKASIRDFLRGINDGKNLFLAACLKESDVHIGNIKLGPLNHFHRRADLGLLIGDKSQWGRGYATEMIRTVTEYGFTGLNLHKVTAGCYNDNPGSANAFLKAGYSQEAVLRKHFFSQGRWVDYVLLAKFATETG